MNSRPDSSDAERPVSNREAGGSLPPQGSTSFAGSSEKERSTQFVSASPDVETSGEDAGSSPAPRAIPSGVRHYVVLRKELSGGARDAQNLHTSADSAVKHVRAGGSYPPDTRGIVLAATKEQLSTLATALDAGGLVFHKTEETDGPLAGSITGLGVIVESEQARVDLAKHLGHLKPSR